VGACTGAEAAGLVCFDALYGAVTSLRPRPVPHQRASRARAMAPGGYSESSAPSDEVTRLALSLRAAAEARLGAAFARFEPVAVSQQVVAGMNYKLKARRLDNKQRGHLVS